MRGLDAMRFLSAVRLVLILFVLTSCSQGKSGEQPAINAIPIKTGKVRARARARIRVGERYGDIA